MKRRRAPGQKSAGVTARTIGGKIRELRSRMGLTSISLGKKLDISQAQVSRLENGLQGFRSGTLMRVAKVLGVAPMYFYVDDPGIFTAGVTKDLKKAGLEPSRTLRKALANPAFLRFMEKCARGAKSQKKLAAMQAAIRRTV